MKAKLKKYLSHDNESYNLISHELNKLATKLIVLSKASKGIEEVEKMTVSFPISQF